MLLIVDVDAEFDDTDEAVDDAALVLADDDELVRLKVRSVGKLPLK